MSSISSVHFTSQFGLVSSQVLSVTFILVSNPILSFERETKDLRDLFRDFPITKEFSFENWLCT